jgi:hypothetical protein
VSNKLKAAIDPIAGEFKWFVAGGGAAWWHISHHMWFWHGAHDWAYFESVERDIFPHDIEGNSIVGVTTTFAGKYGAIDVSLTKMDEPQFTAIDATHCVTVEGVRVFGIDSIITRYRTAGDPQKKAKRDLRAAMLTLVAKQQPITEQGVKANMPKGPNMMMALALGTAKLKHVAQNKDEKH